MNNNKDDMIRQNEKQLKATVDLEEPSEELLEWAKENINENPDTRDLLISDLKDMIYEHGECTPTKTDDKFLLRFLRARYFKIHKAHQLYVNYHNFMEEAPEYFTNLNLERLSKIKKVNIFNCLLNRDQHGRRIIIINVGEWLPAEITTTELLQCAIFLIQVGLLEQTTQIKGVVVLFDLSGLSLEMVWYVTPTLAKHLVNVAMSAMPTRIEAVHFLYSSWTFDTIYSMIKILIPNQVKDRIHFHTDLDTLYSHVDPKYLPKSLGGAQEDYRLDTWYDDLIHSENEKLKDELRKIGYPVEEFLAIENKM